MQLAKYYNCAYDRRILLHTNNSNWTPKNQGKKLDYPKISAKTELTDLFTNVLPIH